MTELNPSYPELAVITCVLLLGVTDFDCKVGELPLDFTCTDTLFGVKMQSIKEHHFPKVEILC